QVANHTEDDRHVDIEHRVIHAVDTQQCYNHNNRVEDCAGYFQNLHESRNQWQVQNQQQDVADVHRGDNAPEEFRLFRNELWVRRDAWEQQSTVNDGQHGVRWDAQGQQWDEGRVR